MSPYHLLLLGLLLKSAWSQLDLGQIILDDVLASIKGTPTQCQNPGADKTVIKDSGVDFSVDQSRWDVDAQPHESGSFLVEMSHIDSNVQQSWTARFGQGGVIYSLQGLSSSLLPFRSS